LHLATLWRRGHSQNLKAHPPQAATYFRNTLLLGHPLISGTPCSWGITLHIPELAAFVDLTLIPHYLCSFDTNYIICRNVEMLKYIVFFQRTRIIWAKIENLLEYSNSQHGTFEKKLIIWQKCVEAVAPALWYQVKQNEIPHSLPHKYICLASVAHSGPSGTPFNAVFKAWFNCAESTCVARFRLWLWWWNELPRQILHKYLHITLPRFLLIACPQAS
jgi:hypothetical protein